jgi:ATP adenylyltransferase
MDRPLWAPWRMEYVGGEKPPGCIFCTYPAAAPGEDRANLVIHRGQQAFVILNRFPYNTGHLMVVPRRHTTDLSGLAEADSAELQGLLVRSLEVVKRVYRPDGLNVGMNLGRAAGAGIPEHLHWHVVPRWLGDNNFMPVLADVRVMVEHLDESWERLSRGFSEG